MLEPGEWDPHADMPEAAIAALYGVDEGRIRDWIADGLAREANGRLNPFTVCNWLSWGRLSESRALARRWQSYLRWFEPFVMGMPERRQITWHREHGFYLPLAASTVTWWLPAVRSTATQECAVDTLDSATAMRQGGLPLWRWTLSDLSPGYHQIRGRAQVRVVSCHADRLDPSEHNHLLALIEDFMPSYHYGYRRHRRRSDGAFAAQCSPGSCLDLSLGLQRYLGQHQVASTLVGGIIAHNQLTNPHFWLEVATSIGAVPVDVTIPAIAKMLGRDWREWLNAYVGGCDARRITLGRGVSPLPHSPPQPFTWALGELHIEDRQARQWNGWPCMDWVCGDCRGRFDHQVLGADR